MSKRMLVTNAPKEKSEDYHGMASYVGTNPDVSPSQLPSLNIKLAFDEAMKLSVAIQSAVFKLNRYNRSTRSGRDMGLLLSLKTQEKTITVIEARVVED